MLIFGTQIKMYLIKSESFLALLDSNVTEMFPGPESKFISKTVHVTSVVQLKFYKATRILFVLKVNKNNDFIQQFFSSKSRILPLW